MKPRCRSIQRYLSDYLDCTLSSEQTATVAQHLQSCHGCRGEAKSLRNTKALLQYYVPPTSPDGYDALFWQQLQRQIEENPRPTWWRIIGRSLSIEFGSSQVFDRCCFFLNSLVRHPIQWSWRWARLSPAYAIILLATLTTMLVYQGFHINRNSGLNPSSAPQYLNSSPSYLAHVDDDRKLVRDKLKKIAQISPTSPSQFAHKTLKQPNLTELATEYLDRNGNPPISEIDSKGLKEIITHDTSSDSPAFAQLSNPAPFLSREVYSQPLRVVISISYSFERKDNRSNSFISGVLADVPLPGLPLAKIL